MMLWGKLVGGFFGYLLMSPFHLGPLGLIIGFIIGNIFDRGLGQSFFINIQQQHHIQHIFFKATFQIMGHVAKADGRVSEAEIQIARSIMQRMQLNEMQKKQAIQYFNEGKQAFFDLEKCLQDLLQVCQYNRPLLQLFVEVQIEAAMAEKLQAAIKYRILQTICQRLGFASIFQQYNFKQGSEGKRESYTSRPSSIPPLQEDYALLNITEKANKSEIKRAYRKLMSQNHPDKLIARGLPEEMIKIATGKTQRIQNAYERICKVRGF